MSWGVWLRGYLCLGDGMTRYLQALLNRYLADVIDRQIARTSSWIPGLFACRVGVRKIARLARLTQETIRFPNQ